jgi:hypothetical protein
MQEFRTDVKPYFFLFLFFSYLFDFYIIFFLFFSFLLRQIYSPGFQWQSQQKISLICHTSFFPIRQIGEHTIKPHDKKMNLRSLLFSFMYLAHGNLF